MMYFQREFILSLQNKGVCFKDKDGYANDSIFFPVADNYYDVNFSGVGTSRYYWSSVPYLTYRAWYLLFGSGYVFVGGRHRSYGCSVRAVCAK